jgi:hypothetical protein
MLLSCINIVMLFERHFDEGEISWIINSLKLMRCLVPRHDEVRVTEISEHLSNDRGHLLNKKLIVDNSATKK